MQIQDIFRVCCVLCLLERKTVRRVIKVLYLIDTYVIRYTLWLYVRRSWSEDIKCIVNKVCECVPYTCWSRGESLECYRCWRMIRLLTKRSRIQNHVAENYRLESCWSYVTCESRSSSFHVYFGTSWRSIFRKDMCLYKNIIRIRRAFQLRSRLCKSEMAIRKQVFGMLPMSCVLLYKDHLYDLCLT